MNRKWKQPPNCIITTHVTSKLKFRHLVVCIRIGNAKRRHVAPFVHIFANVFDCYRRRHRFLSLSSRLICRCHLENNADTIRFHWLCQPPMDGENALWNFRFPCTVSVGCKLRKGDGSCSLSQRSAAPDQFLDLVFGQKWSNQYDLVGSCRTSKAECVHVVNHASAIRPSTSNNVTWNNRWYLNRWLSTSSLSWPSYSFLFLKYEFELSCRMKKKWWQTNKQTCRWTDHLYIEVIAILSTTEHLRVLKCIIWPMSRTRAAIVHHPDAWEQYRVIPHSRRQSPLGLFDWIVFP